MQPEFVRMPEGTGIENYRVVYGDPALAAAAETLCAGIAEATGFRPEAVSDQGEPTAFEILLGNTNRPESEAAGTPDYLHYAVQAVGAKLVVKTGGEHSMYRLASDLTGLLRGEYPLRGGYVNDPDGMPRTGGTDLRGMSLNILAEWENYGGGASPVSRRKEIFFSMLDRRAPDVVGVQEMSPSWFKALADYRNADRWDVLKFPNPVEECYRNEYVYSTVMYRKDRYDLLDSGSQYYSKYNNRRCRCITWALLRDRTSGKTFCYVSTHWDGEVSNSPNASVQVAEEIAFVNRMAENYPVITTGDYNSNEWTNSFKTFLAGTDSADAKYAAAERVNNIGSWHGFGKDTPSVGSCDHLTVTNRNLRVLKFETFLRNEQIYCSDHAWLIADLQILP